MRLLIERGFFDEVRRVPAGTRRLFLYAIFLSMNFQYFDVHSHIQDSAFDADREAALGRMKELGMGAFVVGVDRKFSEDAIELAKKHENLWAVIGQHPTDNTVEAFNWDLYKTWAEEAKVVGIGECGLDYFHELDPEKRDAQKDLFETQLHLAAEVAKPVMVHIRPSKGSRTDAYWDALDILDQFPDVWGNIHFFAGDWEVAQEYLRRGFTLSFTGVITFAKEYDEVIKKMPLESILSETDCPYVAPVPHRGKRNEPAYVSEVVRRIAEIRGESLETVQKALVANARRVFRLP